LLQDALKSLVSVLYLFGHVSPKQQQQDFSLGQQQPQQQQPEDPMPQEPSMGQQQPQAEEQLPQDSPRSFQDTKIVTESIQKSTAQTTTDKKENTKDSKTKSKAASKTMAELESDARSLEAKELVQRRKMIEAEKAALAEEDAEDSIKSAQLEVQKQERAIRAAHLVQEARNLPKQAVTSKASLSQKDEKKTEKQDSGSAAPSSGAAAGGMQTMLMQQPVKVSAAVDATGQFNFQTSTPDATPEAKPQADASSAPASSDSFQFNQQGATQPQPDAFQSGQQGGASFQQPPAQFGQESQLRTGR